MHLKVTVDTCASDGNHLCDEYYTRENSFLRARINHRASGPPPVLWCNPPFDNPGPFVEHVIQQVGSCPGAVGLILFPEWWGSPTHARLKEFTRVHTFPAGTRLFDMPAMSADSDRVPMGPTPWPVHVYRVSHAEEIQRWARALQMGDTPQGPYIFKARAHRTLVRVCTGTAYRVLDEAHCAAFEENPDLDITVLGDTGATHSLIPLRVARQLDLTIDPRRRGRIILGDNRSGVPIQGQCEVPLTLGTYKCTVPALVIDVDWDSTQHLVLGSDWIAKHRVMLGAASGKGPQMDIRGPSGTARHTIYARKTHGVTPMREVPPESQILSAPRFAAMLEAGSYHGESGRPWAAVDVTPDGVQFAGEERRVPLEEFLTFSEWQEYRFARAALQERRTHHAPPTPPHSAPPVAVPPTSPAPSSRPPPHPPPSPTPPPPPPSGAAPPQPAPTHTPAGIPVATLLGWQAKFPTVFQEDLPDRAMSAPVTPRPETIHSIPLLPGAKPVFRRQWRLSPAERDEIAKQLRYHIAKGLVQPSSSPWGAPILFTPKPDGSLRMCIDYRGLNAVTERDVYPLPRAEDLYSKIKGKTVFSSLDLLKGYWQIGIQPCDRHLTAFTTPQGLFEYKVLAMGLTNAPATFQRMMMRIFGDLVDAGSVMVYLDDILVMANSVEEHNATMEEVLRRLADNNLTVRFDKCRFGESELKFLGFIISGETVRADPKKTQAVRDWPVPDTATALRGFLGLANYFRRFIEGYAVMAAPLTALTGGAKNARINLNAVELAAFEAIKAALVSPPILSVEDPTRPYEVITDASGEGVGAVLIQRDDEGRPRVIAYESKAFARKRASVTAQLTKGAQVAHPDGSFSLDQAALEDASGKQELTALLHALKIWRCYLEGAEFTVYVDHNPLTYLLEKQQLNRWQVRILDTLVTYPNLKIQHIPGKTNIADGLSRIHHGPPTDTAPLTVHEATLHAMRTEELPPPSVPHLHRRHFRPTKHAAPLGEAVERLSAMFATLCDNRPIASPATFFQARVTRSSTRATTPHSPAPSTDPVADTPAPAPADAAAPVVPLVNASADPATDATAAPREPGVTRDIMRDREGGSLATDFLQRCANGYVHDKTVADLIAAHTRRTPGPDTWTCHRGLWYSNGALVIPNDGSLRQQCMEQFHDPPGCGHPDALRTRKAIERYYWWPSIVKDVQQYVATCDSCQRMKASRLRPGGFLQPLPIPAERLKHWVIDLAVKFNKTTRGYDSILVMVDRKTRYTLLRPCPAECDASNLVEIFLDATDMFGTPFSVVCDPDSRFKHADGAFQTRLRGLGCEVLVGSVDHHETVGLAERTIQTVKERLRHYIDATHTNWDDLLKAIQASLNNSFLPSIHTTPNYLVLAMHPDMPNPRITNPGQLAPDDQALHKRWLAAERRAEECLEKARRKMLTSANARRRDEHYRVGDQVLLSTKHPWFSTLDGPRKLIPAWVGPFPIIRVQNAVSCTLQLPEEIKCDNTFHAHLLKRYHPDTRVRAPPEPELVDGHEHFEVEAIVNWRERKFRGGHTREEYRVAFKGYGPEYNKWLPEENLDGCQQAIADYHRRRREGVGQRAVAGTTSPACLVMYLPQPGCVQSE